MRTCDKCAARFLYDPANHRCPGEWESICEDAGVAPMHPLPTTTWVEECMAKQGTIPPK